MNVAEKLNDGVFKPWFLYLFLLMTALQVQAGVQELEPGSKEHQHFVQLMHNNLLAWSFHKDDERFDEAGPDYSRRPDTNFWDTAPPLAPYRGWQEYRMAAQNWSKTIVQADISLIRPEDFGAWRHRDVVWNTMYCEVALTLPNGDKPAPRCRGTAIWEWEGDRWRLVHETFSAPVKAGQPVFQAAFSPDPRIEPHLEFTDRAKEVALAWGSGTTDGLAARLKKFYVQDSRLTVFTPWKDFDIYRGWEEVEKGLQKNVSGPFKRVSLTLHNNLEAQQRGELAWTTATMHIETELRDGAVVAGEARQTLIWYFTDQGWRIMHEHFSFPSS